MFCRLLHSKNLSCTLGIFLPPYRGRICWPSFYRVARGTNLVKSISITLVFRRHLDVQLMLNGAIWICFCYFGAIMAVQVELGCPRTYQAILSIPRHLMESCDQLFGPSVN